MKSPHKKFSESVFSESLFSKEFSLIYVVLASSESNSWLQIDTVQHQMLLFTFIIRSNLLAENNSDFNDIPVFIVLQIFYKFQEYLLYLQVQ